MPSAAVAPAISTETHDVSPQRKSKRHSNVNRLKAGDILTLSVTKADKYMEAGLNVVKRGGGKFYISSLSGLCLNIPLQVGDELLELCGEMLKDFSLSQVKDMIENELRLDMVVRRCDPNDNNVVLVDGDEEEDEEQQHYEEDDYDSDEIQYGHFNNNDEVASDSLFQPGSAARLLDIDSKPSLNGQTVSVKHETKQPGTFECELQDGSRISVSERNMEPIQELQDFQPYVPGSERSLFCNLIEPGDVMKIRGLKKQAKMNGTLVEILRVSESQPGRWECVLCDDKERVIAVMSENLRHIM